MNEQNAQPPHSTGKPIPSRWLHTERSIRWPVLTRSSIAKATIAPGLAADVGRYVAVKCQVEGHQLDEDTGKDYLRDLGMLIKEYALEAVKDRDESKGTESEDYKTGYVMGFQRVLSLMQQQAESFGMSLNDISLSDIDAYRDIL